jgi:hypothetical protein
VTGTWSRNDAALWSEGLRLVSRPWLSTQLETLGIERRLATRSELLRAAWTEALENPALVGRIDGPAVGDAVMECLSHLAAATSAEDANGLQQWLERHFMCREMPIAMYTWKAVLVRAGADPGGMYARVDPPDALNRLLPEIATLLDEQGLDGFERDLRLLGPPATAEDLDIGLTESADVLRAREIANNERTSAALRLLSVSLDPEERMAVAGWAEEQAVQLDMVADRLGGVSWLDDSLACPDAPPTVRIR